MNRFTYTMAALFLAITAVATDGAYHIAYAAEDEKAPTIDSLQDTKLHSRTEFVNGMAQMTLAILQDPQKPYGERRVLLRRAFATVVDIDWIARFVLGRAWNMASTEEQEKYVDLYRAYLTETYVSNFGENQEHRIRDISIVGIQDAEDTDFLVNTTMKLANADDVKVAYRVSDHDGKYKIVDIVIENVSLLTMHRAELAQLALSQGVSGVITKLETTVRDYDHAMLKLSMQ